MTKSIIKIIEKLCKERKVSVKIMLESCGLNKSVVDNIKKGSVPSVDKMKAIADYFGVTVDYLLGAEEKKPVHVDELSIGLSDHEKSVIRAYRLNPNIQPAVDRLLCIDSEYVQLFTAAQSTDNSISPRIIFMKKEEWEKIKQAPETDDPLI